MQRPTDEAGGIDPREIITPDSFSVSPDLIGLPLARPLRRGAAMLLDMVPLALLVNANAVFFAMAAAILLWRASRSATGADVRFRRWRRLLRVGAVLLTFVVVLDVIGDVEGRFSGRDAGAPAPPRAPEVEIGEINVQPPLGTPENEQPQRGALLTLLGGIADDLGIGFGWTALYFTAFLALANGQTPGKRVLGIQVIRLDGRPIGWWIAFERFGGYAASIWTGLLGFLQIFWDRNRQGIHDKIAETVVIRTHGARFQPRR